ncbi:MAG: nuclear transport factor 2 family protein [Lentimicrobiaceae bacterium]|jgi:ketosteroid isomerase-like protein
MITKSRLFSFFAISVMMVAAFTACTQKKHIDSKILLDTDRYYSGLSAEKGMNAAFLAMFDSAGVKLQSKHMPIEGYEAIKAALMSQSDSTFTLTWEPMFAKISISGDMGYTYGTYKVTDKATDSISGEGTYTTIWMKKKNGKWKAMLDTGNPGLGK